MSGTGVGVAHTQPGQWVWPGLEWAWLAVGMARVGVGVAGSGLAGAHLPDTRLLAIHHRHVVGLAVFDELLLGLIELLGHKAHEGVVWGVSYSTATKGGEGVMTCLSQESQPCRWGEHPWVGRPGLERATELGTGNLQGHLAPQRVSRWLDSG